MRKATKKDYQAVREKTTPFAKALREDIRHADLKDHGSHATITMDWGTNQDMIRDRVFKLTINGESAYIDSEELLSYTRLL